MVDAKTAYLQRHCVPELIDGLINKLVDDEPSDPQKYLADCLRKGALFGNLPGGELPDALATYAGELQATVRLTCSASAPATQTSLRERVAALLDEFRSHQAVTACDAHRDILQDDVIVLTIRVADAAAWKELRVASTLQATAAHCGGTAEFFAVRVGME
eukprot:TRINITY_DN44520_c0_g1_i1.p1 TRINITY_DN44520_c0_g1~~TRINITY_DN44520_c0_g1_i1.p1  ORF type:complete len:160 (+),score=58.45 TRINITY_DN44520_c0_g1_i1:69-548(+)